MEDGGIEEGREGIAGRRMEGGREEKEAKCERGASYYGTSLPVFRPT